MRIVAELIGAIALIGAFSYGVYMIANHFIKKKDGKSGT